MMGMLTNTFIILLSRMKSCFILTFRLAALRPSSADAVRAPVVLPQVEHRYFAEILRDGAEAVTAPLQPDWIPAVEWGRFQRVRDSATALPAMPAHARIRPQWDPAAGTPYVSQVEVNLGAPGAGVEFLPLQYFAGAVQHAVSDLIEVGKISQGDPYRWRICAYRAPQIRHHNIADGAFQVEECAIASAAPEVRSFSTLLAGAQYHGPRAVPAGRPDVPVFFAPRVLREAAAAATAAGTLEAGGILLGTLARDAASGDLSIDITAQIPAREAIADDASLRFTPGTWQAVHAALNLRRAGEQIVGWWHSHPQSLWACRNCPPERRAVCPSDRAFFSAMDVQFHRTAFQLAHNLALLLSFLDQPAPRFDLFGWHRGMVGPRGYYVTEDR